MNLLVKRILTSFIGVVICGIFAGVFEYAGMGVDPFQSASMGISSLFTVDYGTFYALFNAVLLLFSLLFGRHYIGLATLLNLFFLGYVMDFVYSLLVTALPDPLLWLRLVLMILSIFGLCLSLSLYGTANLGVSTYDAIALIISNDWKKMPFRLCRILTDFCCVALGSTCYILSGHSFSDLFSIVGIGTVLAVLCMGPIISWLNDHFSIPLVYGKKQVPAA